VVGSGLFRTIQNSWHSCFGGRTWTGGWCYGLANATFYRDVVGLDLPGDTWDRNRAYEDMMAAGWIWPHREFAIVCEPPTEIHREPQRGHAVRRLHRADGPAVRWGDGVGAYFIHGVYVASPEWIIDSSELTVTRVQGEENAEVRRVMIDRYGADRYLRDAGASLVSEDDYGRLWRLPLPGDEPIVMVEVRDATPIHELGAGATIERIEASLRGEPSFKRYWLRCPPSTATPLEAVAWAADMTPAEYARIVVHA